MTRPHYPPGSTAAFIVRNRSGKKDLAHYIGARIGVVYGWARDLVDSGHVKLNGTIAKPGDLINLSAGPHNLEISFPEPWPRHMAATEMTLEILHEDPDLVVLNKPPGRVVHPARGHLDNQTLQNGMRHRYRHLLALEETTIGSPHRLDKDTSGAIVFALNRAAYANLVAQFSNSTPHKEYLAIVDGSPNFPQCVCNGRIGNDPARKGLGKVVGNDEDGKAARSDFRILERGPDWALALVVPHTGRPHQIRVHAANLGLPLAGDRDYNPNPDRLRFSRQALHARALTFTHPRTGETLRVEAPLTSDLVDGLERLRKEASCKSDALL